MRNSFLNRLRKCSGKSLGIITLLAWAVVRPAVASPELDRQYNLGTVGLLRAWDNVDGLFADYVTAAYKDYLGKQSRFTVQELGKADSILTSSKIPYVQLIDDEQVLSQLAKQLRLESIIRTKVYKEGPQYRFVIDWLLAPKIQLLATETITLDRPFGSGEAGDSEFRSQLSRALERVVARIPFVATVTGRDAGSVTVNIGSNAGLKSGDTLILGTIEEVKFHPLLKTVVDWRVVRTGKVEVDEVDEGMAFCKLSEEEYGREIMRFQKVVQVIPAAEPLKSGGAKSGKRGNGGELVNGATDDGVNSDADERAKEFNEPPRTGWLSPGLFMGQYSRQSSATSGTTGYSGSGFLIGFKGEGELWLTRDFFSDLQFTYGSAGYKQKDIATGTETNATGVSASLSQVKLSVGYVYHLTPDFFGPRGWIKGGYQSTSYSLPKSTTEQTSPASFSGLVLGLGGDLPVRGGYGANVNLDFGLFTSGEESGAGLGTVSGSSSVDFFIGGYANLQPRLTLRIGLDFKAQSIDFAKGNTLSHKVVAFGPSLLFYF